MTNDRNLLKKAKQIMNVLNVEVLSPTPLILRLGELSEAQAREPDRVAGPGLQWHRLHSKAFETFPFDRFLEQGEKLSQLRGCVRSLGHVLEWRYETQTIPQRPDRRTVGCSGFPTPISQDRGKATYCRPTGGRQRHCVRSAQRLHVASHAA